MKTLLLFILSFLITIVLLANNRDNELGVYQLTQQGWQVQEKKSSIDHRPGVEPYQNLGRKVQVTLHRLNRGDDLLFCRMEYDSQQETLREFCGSSFEEAAEYLAE
ncbi:MAG: hypothetical protein GY786_08515 [Proteobacteria bacterium]|nr:hypothetical protein [Pseudomonadota bacterium]